MATKSRYANIELKPAAEPESLDDYEGVWVIVEQREGNVQDVTRELLGAAIPMAEKLNTTVTALLLGHETGDMAERLITYGADKVVRCHHPILNTPLAQPSTDVIAKLVKERRPTVVLIGATHTGRDVSSRVAVKIDAGMTADCTELDVDSASGELLARRPAFGGKMLATIRCDRHRPQMATARPGIFVPNDPDPARAGEVEDVDVAWLNDNTYHAEVVDYIVDKSSVDITKADVLVACGLGVGGPEGLDALRELADALGGELACSRPVADKGWLPREHQIGQTGLSARPKLYVAVGVSGAIQHIEGMKESGTVIAINSDANAAIFDYADIGLVGDWKGLVAGLTKAAKAKNLHQAKWMVPVKDTLAADREAAHERAIKAGKADADAPAEAAPAASAPAAAPQTAKPKVEAAAPAAAAASDSTPNGKGEAGAEAAAPADPEPAASVEEASAAGGEFAGDPTDADAVRAWVKDNVPEDKKAWVLADDCIVCNGCDAACPTGAAVTTDVARVDRDLCIADGACFDACPTDAIRPGVEDPESTAGWPEGSRLAGQVGV